MSRKRRDGYTVYICKKNDLTLVEIRRFFNTYIQDHEEESDVKKYLHISVTDFEERYQQTLHGIPKTKRHLFTKKVFSLHFDEEFSVLPELLWFRIDNLLPESQKYLEKNYTVIKKICI